MKIPIIDIGNSKGIRIPQAFLKQVMFGDEIEMEVAEGKIVLRRATDIKVVPEFDALSQTDDPTIQRILRKISGCDLITAMVGATDETKAAVYRNLSERVRSYVQTKVEKLEKGDARDLIIERSRNLISEAFMTVIQE